MAKVFLFCSHIYLQRLHIPFPSKDQFSPHTMLEILAENSWQLSKLQKEKKSHTRPSRRRRSEALCYQKDMFCGTGVAQLVMHAILAFGSGHDFRVVGSSPVSGSHSAWCLLKTLSRLPLPLSLFARVCTHMLAFSFSVK